ncbi:NADP-dependent oxidoreductase [Corallococcus exiguus]|uniref:NADP-dependent oxidoreductase n=1 Tax=Corallococcus TaxID=83461 RepID=UPI000EE1E211|nr:MULTISPECIES: NADP-dependent oxidoreductase [Corallococcus]NNB87570.1 NADP-dependent oxidoreductase [Corallococcus exiguus]NNB96495.1 NADP-dependent oxidoreductase [Corallococcus exiguus]NNC05046.1 NADP-dependent oxidoreductase [Corallococcus exiguus]NPC48936.1 NADP-dependent oxidoreductase [Corallococcus exiguus]RKH85213.1 NADP-dependent oxidoreductase [Corallococcus sp. AB032C]
MKAVVLKGYGDVDVLAVQEMPEPKVGPGEVKVRVTAAGINPVDWKIRRGDMKGRMDLKFPTILGRDVAGEVVEVGTGVEDFEPGDRVMGLVNAGYAETVVAPTEAWAKVPDNLDLRAAAALPLVTLTGTQLIEEHVRPSQGETVLVTGALGAVGRSAVFAARARGAKIWAGVRKTQVEEARKLGVDGVVALDDPKDVAKLPTLDAVADTVGGEAVAAVLDKVKHGGTVGSVLGEPKGAKEKGLVVRSFMAHPDARRLEQIAVSAAKGDLVIPISRTFKLDDAREAQKVAEQGGVGKVLLVN